MTVRRRPGRSTTGPATAAPARRDARRPSTAATTGTTGRPAPQPARDGRPSPRSTAPTWTSPRRGSDRASFVRANPATHKSSKGQNGHSGPPAGPACDGRRPAGLRGPCGAAPPPAGPPCGRFAEPFCLRHSARWAWASRRCRDRRCRGLAMGEMVPYGEHGEPVQSEIDPHLPIHLGQRGRGALDDERGVAAAVRLPDDRDARRLRRQRAGPLDPQLADLSYLPVKKS